MSYLTLNRPDVRSLDGATPSRLVWDHGATAYPSVLVVDPAGVRTVCTRKATECGEDTPHLYRVTRFDMPGFGRGYLGWWTDCSGGDYGHFGRVDPSDAYSDLALYHPERLGPSRLAVDDPMRPVHWEARFSAVAAGVVAYLVRNCAAALGGEHSALAAFADEWHWIRGVPAVNRRSGVDLRDPQAART